MQHNTSTKEVAVFVVVVVIVVIVLVVVVVIVVIIVLVVKEVKLTLKHDKRHRKNMKLIVYKQQRQWQWLWSAHRIEQLRDASRNLLRCPPSTLYSAGMDLQRYFFFLMELCCSYQLAGYILRKNINPVPLSYCIKNQQKPLSYTVTYTQYHIKILLHRIFKNKLYKSKPRSLLNAAIRNSIITQACKAT